MKSYATKTVKIALLGCGNVGSEVAKKLLTEAEYLSQRAGVFLELKSIVVKNLGTVRDPILDKKLFTLDAVQAIEEADVVIETMGGLLPARELILQAVKKGKSVVTANKALLAEEDSTVLFSTAKKNGAFIAYEAAVAAAIPIVGPIKNSLLGDKIISIMGIINGTTNYILDQMSKENMQFSEALLQAQKLGYAEANPVADVEGFDAAAKIAILASLAFHTKISISQVHCEGISSVGLEEIVAAEDDGYVIKMLAIAEVVNDVGVEVEDKISVRVHPTLISKNHPLAGVSGAYNAIFVESVLAGSLMFYGQGAGGAATASAVLGDLVQVVQKKFEVLDESFVVPKSAKPVLLADLDQICTKFQVRLQVVDQSGVLAKITNIFAKYEVSLETFRQIVCKEGSKYAKLNIITHKTSSSNINKVIVDVLNLSTVQNVLSVIRVGKE